MGDIPADAHCLTTATGFRPSYFDLKKNEVKNRGGASAPDYLNFLETPGTRLCDLSEDEFRKTIVRTLAQLDNLGLNRSKGGSYLSDPKNKLETKRAAAYLDVVTWDDAYRTSWTDNNEDKSSSCGMLVRNTWWLCGLRDPEPNPKKPNPKFKLLNDAYHGDVLGGLTSIDSRACKPFGKGFTAKTFWPKIGDVFYLYDVQKQKHRHMFTVCEIDKKIELDDDGNTIVRDADGSPATEISFTSVDGGQQDGTGWDSKKKKQKSWGCQGIKKCGPRVLPLDGGHFITDKVPVTYKGKPATAEVLPFPFGTPKTLPLLTWISVGEMQDRFTANLISAERLDFDS